jgi:hypothetical protein
VQKDHIGSLAVAALAVIGRRDDFGHDAGIWGKLGTRHGQTLADFGGKPIFSGGLRIA